MDDAARHDHRRHRRQGAAPAIEDIRAALDTAVEAAARAAREPATQVGA